MSRVLVVASLVFLVACSHKKDEERVAPQTSPVGPAPVAPAPEDGVATHAEAPVPVKLTCEAVFPKALQDTYFPGGTVTEVAQTTDFSAGCQVTPAKATTAVELNVTCHDNVIAAKDTVLASVKDMQDMPGVGAPARKKDLGVGGTQIMAWDDDSNCQVLGMLPKGVDAAAFTRDLLAALPAG